MYRINKLEKSVKELNRKVDSCLVAKTIVLKIKDKKSNNVNDSITTKKIIICQLQIKLILLLRIFLSFLMWKKFLMESVCLQKR